MCKFCSTKYKFNTGVESIGYFKEKETGSELFIMSSGIDHKLEWDNSGGECMSGSMRIKYCPVCGRYLEAI